jgi:S1-C subfamily serine protease
LISYGRIQRPSLGLELASDRWIRRYRIEGLPVVRVFPGLPADRAGIRGAYRNARGEILLGDIITAVDGEAVRSNDDYLSLIEQHEPGDTVTITLRRGDERREVRVRLSESE